MSKALIWFRQDLRLMDNPAFAQACNEHEELIPLYILDASTNPLGGAQKWWLHHSLHALHATLGELGLHLILRQGPPLALLMQLIDELSIDTVYWNRCYEPVAIQRDQEIKKALIYCIIFPNYLKLLLKKNLMLLLGMPMRCYSNAGCLSWLI